jgi:hypothetical protein
MTLGWLALGSAAIGGAVTLFYMWLNRAGGLDRGGLIRDVLGVVYAPAGLLGVLTSPNVHSPSDLLLWFWTSLETFLIARVVLKVGSLVRRLVRTQRTS